MQPSSAKVSDTSDPVNVPTSSDSSASTKKRRAKKKTTAKPIESDAVKIDPVVVSAETRSPGPYRGKCLYQSRKCENERAIKRNGKPHNLCEEHRSKQNQHQRKFDAKKFSRKRRRGSVSDEDTKVENKKLQVHRSEEPSVKYHRIMTNQEAETRTPTHVSTPNVQPPTSMIPTMRGTYSTAGSTPISAPLPRLPPIQSPQGSILPPSPTVAYMHSSSMRQGHVVYSEYRSTCRTDQMVQQSPRVSHRPYLQQQVSQGYSHSELVAASILIQPQQSPSPAAVSTPVYYSRAASTPRETRGPAMTTPHALPSLLISPSAALSPYHRVSGIVPSSSQRFAPVVVTPASSVSVSPARSTGHILPPLVPFGLRRSPTSTPSVSRPLNK